MNDEPIPLEDEIYEEEIEVEEETAVMNAMWGNISGNIANQTDLQQALDAKQDNLTQAQLDAVNSGITSAKVATYDGYPAQITSAVSSEADIRRQADTTLQSNIDAEERARKAADKDIQDVVDGETLARQNADNALGGRIDTEIHDRQVADNGLQSQIDAITSKSDVVDVVATYADLQAYDTQHLGDNDVIKVLDDETHGDALTYYRWSKTNQTWTFIGQEAPYYSKSQTDTLLLGKQNTIDSSHKLSADLVDDTSTTNKFVTASDIANWNGKQDALTAGTGIDITGGVISTPAIVPEVVAELPTTGAEGKLYLTPKAHTTSTATGNPIEANITAQAGQLESFQLDGDTFQQSYTGKNLVNLTTMTASGVSSTNNGDGTVTITGTASESSSVAIMNAAREIEAGTYTLTISKALPFTINLSYRGVSFRIAAGSTSATSTATGNFASGNLWMVITEGTTYNETFGIQLTQGSTPDTTYEPFVGGQPSPNPDYPQQIQTVTGTQTISINGTDYPINLGSLELCKLGTYQDYIWKDGESWKVHKATSKVILTGNEQWSGNNITEGFFYTHTNSYDTIIPFNTVAGRSSVADFYDGVLILETSVSKSVYSLRSNSATYPIHLRFKLPTEMVSSRQEWVDYLKSHETIVYYTPATSTDTTITNTTLIAQLEAIRTASLENGTNAITNTATGTNLAGDMEIGYYGYNPTNRYDKFIWLNLNNNYEQIGGE